MFSLENKISVITGGGSGIGRAIALLFAKQGSEVHILDIDENAKAVVEEINTAGGRSFFHKCSVTQQPSSQFQYSPLGDGGMWNCQQAIPGSKPGEKWRLMDKIFALNP